MLEFQNFGCMTTSTIKLESRDKILSYPLFQNTFILRKSRIVILVDYIKIGTIFITKIFED